MTVGSVWHRPGQKRGYRNHPQWWKQLQAEGKCPSCWKLRDREGTLCTRCAERAKLQARRKRGWDGKSTWQPQRTSKQPRRSVCATITLATYEQLQQVVRDQSTTVGALVREAVESYIADICEEVPHAEV